MSSKNTEVTVPSLRRHYQQKNKEEKEKSARKASGTDKWPHSLEEVMAAET